MLARVGIPNPERRVDDYPHQLSGGMRQRVMIAMALINGPALLIADEPTTALDVTVQAQIMELLGELQEQYNTAIILITHDLGVVADVADEVAVMYAGRLVERGTLNDIFYSPEMPYTVGLLASVPRLDAVSERLTPIARAAAVAHQPAARAACSTPGARRVRGSRTIGARPSGPSCSRPRRPTLCGATSTRRSATSSPPRPWPPRPAVQEVPHDRRLRPRAT